MKLRGATSRFRPWSAEEKGILAKAYAGGGVAAAKTALPLRSVMALYHAADRLGVERKRQWTSGVDAALRNLWGAEIDIKAIAERLGRTRTAVYLRAAKIGLPVGCPEGWEYLSAATTRTGYSSTSTLVRILRWAGVGIERAVTLHHKRQSKRPTRIVVPELVDDAIAEWHKTETLEGAARRCGVRAEELKRWLAAVGVVAPVQRRSRKHWRVYSSDVDQAVLSRGR